MYEDEIRRTLRNILEYVEADSKYYDYAELISYLENLLRICGVEDV